MNMCFCILCLATAKPSVLSYGQQSDVVIRNQVVLHWVLELKKWNICYYPTQRLYATFCWDAI